MLDDGIKDGLAFDDVLVLPSASSTLPKDVDICTRLTPEIRLSIPIISAAMDTVTEARAAIAMAQEGGIGIIHKNWDIERHVHEVACVKKYESGVVAEPHAVSPDTTIGQLAALSRRHDISGFPVTEGSRLVGMVTNRDIKTVEPYPNAAKDSLGRLRVGAAIGVGGPEFERAEALMEACADVLVVDTAHGHAASVIEMVKRLRMTYPDLQLIAGNIATAEAARALIGAGASALKVGVGPGSVCTTRVVAGCGVPQITAITDVASVAGREGIPVIADGGIKFSGDIVKALAAGAESVMIGQLLAGTDETPGEVVLYQGRSYKVYRGMGSLQAMREGGRDRYFQGEVAEASKLVPEGIEGRVPYRGRLRDVLYQMVGGLRQGMGYAGASTIGELASRTKFIRITAAGHRESHVHGVVITKEAPNYSVE